MPTRLFPYPGGKTRAIPTLAALLDQHFPNMKRLYSPFLGGGSFELYVAGTLKKPTIVNDGFCPLMDFWQALQADESRQEMSAFVKEHHPLSRDDYTKLKIIAADKPSFAKLALGVRGAIFLLLIRASFGGGINTGWNKEQAARPVTDVEQWYEKNQGSTTIERMTFRCSDWSTFIKRYRSAGKSASNVLFVDPPYKLGAGRHHLYGFKGEMHREFDHHALRKELGKRSHWILCYNDTPEIRKMYAGYTIVPVSWSYSMHNTKQNPEKTNTSREIVILSV
jgi:DNA adenine methylase